MTRGYKEFALGELVEAATGTQEDMNDIWSKQVVMYFADATARDAAITTPEEGMHAYLADDKIVTEYDGSDWVVFPAAPLVAGDLLYFNGTKWVRLPPGSAGQSLRINTAEDAPEWVSVGEIQVETGSYVGDGTNGRAISLSLSPKKVTVTGSPSGANSIRRGESADGVTGSSGLGWSLNASGVANATTDAGARPQLDTAAFTVSSTTAAHGGNTGLNVSGVTYFYTAIG